MSVIKLEATGSAGTTTNSAAAIDVPVDGVITAVDITIKGDALDAADDQADAELSFLSTNSFSTNDVRNSLAMVTVQNNAMAAATGQGSKHKTITGLRIPVFSGERIHLHLNGDTGVTPAGYAYIFIEDRIGARTRRR